MSELKTAISRLEAMLARTGPSAAALNELGALKLATGDAPGAVEAYSNCLTFASHNAGLHNNLGTALIKAGRFEAAIAALETALTLQPGYLRALVNLGKALCEAGRAAEARVRLHEALRIQPDYVPALVNLGDACAALGDLDAARRALERAIELSPLLVESRMTLGMVHWRSGRIAESLETLRAALALAPEHPDVHSNLAHVLFVSGDWRAAWPHFESRFRRHAHRAPLQAPGGALRWDGTCSPGVELWLVGEQGLGDQLQFVRYARCLGDQGMECVVSCDPRLVRLLGMAPLRSRIVPLGTPAGPMARWVPLMSLPQWHRTEPGTVPLSAGYLAADCARIAEWRTRLSPTRKLRVALAWAGNPAMETGLYAGRSPSLAALAPLMAVPGIEFISLQKGHGEEQLDAVAFGPSIRRLPTLDAQPDAFLDTAAILKCVDLLVTSDTAIAHLGGGLGVPTWLCLMHEPDWRWMLQRSDSPWYASMRLFRQRIPADWSGVYEAVAAALTEWVAQRCTS